MTRTFSADILLPGKMEGWEPSVRQIQFTLYIEERGYDYDWCRARVDGKWLMLDKDLYIIAEGMPLQWRQLVINKLYELLTDGH